MNGLDMGRVLLNSPLSGPLLDVACWLLYRDPVRSLLVRAGDAWLQSLQRNNDRVHPSWRTIMRQRLHIYRAVLHTLDRVVTQRLLAPQVARTIVELWGRALCSASSQQAVQRFRQERGCNPPWFLVISPGRACNLSCPGCYADSSPTQAKMDWPTVDRLMTEAKELWGVPLFVFSGGEPLLYRSQGKDVLDLVEKHADCLFLMFTNGTMIDAAVAARLARLGNLTPAVSVEGMRERTDARRGAGAFDRALAAMAHLRHHGVPFGISATVTRDNCEEVLSDEVLDFFFGQQGAFYAFLFQYVPMGRDADPHLAPSPQQAIAFWRRSWQVVIEKRFFLLDFGHHGPLVEGCIAAGRDRGYLHIDWNGNVLPCVFAPFAAANINHVYAQGGTLNDVWASPFLQAIRQWQRDYGYGRRELSAEGNWLSPCPFRDHPHLFRGWVQHYGADPQDESARAILEDPLYEAAMMACSAGQRRATQEIWEKEYLGIGQSPTG